MIWRILLPFVINISSQLLLKPTPTGFNKIIFPKRSRLHLFTGSNGLSVGHPAVLDNSEPNPGFPWPTMAEILEKEGISWRVYQERDNFDDNAFAWFESFMTAKPGNPLYDKGIATLPDLVAGFKEDVESGKLPQVCKFTFRSLH